MYCAQVGMPTMRPTISKTWSGSSIIFRMTINV
jgi:hypothetical protein